MRSRDRKPPNKRGSRHTIFMCERSVLRQNVWLFTVHHSRFPGFSNCPFTALVRCCSVVFGGCIVALIKVSVLSRLTKKNHFGFFGTRRAHYYRNVRFVYEMFVFPFDSLRSFHSVCQFRNGEQLIESSVVLYVWRMCTVWPGLRTLWFFVWVNSIHHILHV